MAGNQVIGDGKSTCRELLICTIAAPAAVQTIRQIFPSSARPMSDLHQQFAYGNAIRQILVPHHEFRERPTPR